MKKLLLPVIVFALTLFAPNDSFTQRKPPKTKDALVFTIVKLSNPGGNRIGRRFHWTDTFHFYASGRVACQSEGSAFGRKVNHKKPNCRRLAKAKFAKLLELAEQTNFLEAADSYQFFEDEISLAVTYFRSAGAKEIYLTRRWESSNAVPLPPSVAAFLGEIAAVDERLKVEIRKN